jgi:phosphomannomutase
MTETLHAIMQKGVKVGIVSGSDLSKIKEQVGEEVIKSADYTFAENGLYAMKNGDLFASSSIKDQLGEDLLKRFINFCLRYMSDLDIPIKRYNLEYRKMEYA